MKLHPKPLIFIALALLVIIITGVYQYQQHRHSPLHLYGNVDIRTLDISFRVGGRLAALQVDEGDSITAGQPLGRLDDAPYQLALQQANASVDIAAADYALAKAGYRDEEIARARAGVHQAQAAYDYAQQFAQRQQRLWQQHSLSANDLENARATRDQAKASLKAMQDQLAQYQRGNRPQQIAAARAAWQLALAKQAKARLDLQDTLLTAPASGIVLTRVIEPGSMINASAPVLSLSLTRPVWVRAYASETELGQLQPGRAVLIHTDSRPRPYHGKIGFVSPDAEFTPKTVETPDLRSQLVYRLRIIVTDPDPQLRQGMPVTVTLENATDQAPASHTSVNRSSVDHASINSDPVNNASINNASVNNPSINNIPVNNTSINNDSVNDASINNIPVNNASINDASVNNASTNSAPVNNTSVNNASVNNPSINNAPINHAPHTSATGARHE